MSEDGNKTRNFNKKMNVEKQNINFVIFFFKILKVLKKSRALWIDFVIILESNSMEYDLKIMFGGYILSYY